MTKDELRGFEAEVADAFKAKKIPGPIHLSGGNEDQLIGIFRDVRPGDWCFCSYRQHYHALLKGIPREVVMAEILAGRSMGLSNVEHRFYSTAIVGGHLQIAVGVAAALKRQKRQERVWCFLGDMAATTGAFREAHRYATGYDLPIRFVIEDNGLSVQTPTEEVWGYHGVAKRVHYRYEREWPHSGIKEWVRF